MDRTLARVSFRHVGHQLLFPEEASGTRYDGVTTAPPQRHGVPQAENEIEFLENQGQNKKPSTILANFMENTRLSSEIKKNVVH